MAKVKKVNTPVFDLSKNYGWSVDDQLSLSGIELDVLNKAFEAVLSSPFAVPVLAAQQGKQAITSILKKGVEEGVIKEVEKVEEEK
jgi:hypothetical protein